MKFVSRSAGFTLIELMIVVAIVAFLSMVSIPSLLRFLAKAKRSEAYMNLGSLYAAQKSHFAENNSYSAQLSGPNSVGWSPEGYTTGGKNERFNYTYGFSEGAEGTHHFTGKLETSPTALANTKATKANFIAAAVGDIDNDGQVDLLTINDLHDIKLVQDDLS